MIAAMLFMYYKHTATYHKCIKFIMLAQLKTVVPFKEAV